MNIFPIQGNNPSLLEPASQMTVPRTTDQGSYVSSRDVNPRWQSFDFTSMRTEEARLYSFLQPPGWQNEYVTPADCARAGFFFTRDGDKVQCAFCRGVIGEWQPGDEPFNEHLRHFPMCRFVSQQPVGNVPFQRERSENRTGYHVTRNNEPPSMTTLEANMQDLTLTGAGYQNCSEDRRFKSCNPAQLESKLLASYGIIFCEKGPVEPNFATAPSRLKTFQEWPTRTGQKPETLVESGFFYMGENDFVKCYYCGGGLRNWSIKSNPHAEHLKWYPYCPYVKLYKQDMHKDESTEKAASTNLFSKAADKVMSYIVAGQKRSVKTLEATTKFSFIFGRVNHDDDKKQTSDKHVLEDQLGMNKPSKHGFKDQVRKLEEHLICKICMDDQVDVVFLPCCHFVSCRQCAAALSKCAYCREPIRAIVKVFLA